MTMCQRLLGSITLRLAILGGYLATLYLIVSITNGFSSPSILPASSLRVRQLKALLEFRGLRHSGLFEKKELVDVVEGSGYVTSEEATSAEDLFLSSTERSSIHAGGWDNPDLWDEMIKHGNRAYLIHVTSGLELQQTPLLNETSWRKVVENFQHLDIQTEVVDCSASVPTKRLCVAYEWDSTQIVLGFHNLSERKVLLNVAKFPSPADFVIHWVHEQLADVVTVIPDVDHLGHNWLRMDGRTYTKAVSTQVHVVFVTHLSRPPSYLGALAAQFAGRIQFAMYTVEKGSIEEEEIKSKIGEIPSFAVVRSESGSSVIYGRRGGEAPTYKNMKSYLETLPLHWTPAFAFGLLITNMLAFLEMLLDMISGHLPFSNDIFRNENKFEMYLLVTAVYNSGFFVIWAVLHGLMENLLLIMWMSAPVGVPLSAGMMLAAFVGFWLCLLLCAWYVMKIRPE